MLSFFKLCKIPLLLTLVAIVFWGCQTTPQPPEPVAVQPEPEEPERDLEKEAAEEAARKAAEETERLAAKPKPKVTPRLSIASQAKSLGGEAARVPDSDEWIVSKGDVEIRLTVNSRRAFLNDTLVFLGEPFERRKGAFALSKRDFELFLKPSLQGVADSLKSRTIAIDPGHGGTEDGAKNEELELLEKDLALEVSLRLQEKLEALGYETVLTRYDDRLVPLGDRAEIANRADAGVFVSIHFNGSLNTEALGLETFTLTPAGQPSTGSESPGENAIEWPGNKQDALNFQLGITVQKNLIKDLQRTDRGLKKARFAALKALECPGVLVECGFLTNADEALLVRTPVYREKLASSLSRSIDAFVKQYGPSPEADSPNESSSG